MKKFAVLAALAMTIGLIPTHAAADHVNFIPDAKDCAEMAAPGGVFTDPDQSDRGALCTSDGNAANGPEYYLGGEGQTETAYPDEDHQAGDACGALVIGGQVASATRSDDPATDEDERLDWDWIHVHDPDGVADSGDEFDHHHSCD